MSTSKNDKISLSDSCVRPARKFPQKSFNVASTKYSCPSKPDILSILDFSDTDVDIDKSSISSSESDSFVRDSATFKGSGSEAKLPENSVEEDDKSKDFFDDATMEHVRHNLFQLSSINGMVSGGPPSAITFHSSVSGRRVSENGKVNLLLHWSPENIIPDSWIPEDAHHLHLEKTIPVSHLPHDALELPELGAIGSAGIFSPPGKRRRK